jgi:hypothetical protein
MSDISKAIRQLQKMAQEKKAPTKEGTASIIGRLSKQNSPHPRKPVDTGSARWQYEIFLPDGKQIPTAVYWRQQKIEALGCEAKRLLAWWQKRPNPVVTMVEICKCLTPVHLRKTAIIRPIVQELLDAGLIKKNGAIIHRRVRRAESWKLISLVEK